MIKRNVVYGEEASLNKHFSVRIYVPNILNIVYVYFAVYLQAKD